LKLEQSLSVQVEAFRVAAPCNVVVIYKCEDAGSMDPPPQTLVSYHNTTRRHNPEEVDVSHQRRESLKLTQNEGV